MTSINFKVIGLTRPAFEPSRFRFANLPKWEIDALLIQLSHLVITTKEAAQYTSATSSSLQQTTGKK